MATALPVITRRERRPGGCCVAPVEPDLDQQNAADLAAIAKALGDPTRLRIVDVVRKAAPEAICQCEMTPLFDMSQPALSKHLKVLIGAGILGAEKRGAWTYYYERPEARKELIAWLS